MQVLSKSKKTRVRALKSSRNRSKYQECVAEGFKIVKELLDEYVQHISFICLKESYDYGKLSLPYEKTYFVTEDEFNELSSQANPDGILAVVKTTIFDNTRMGNLYVFLDGIKDPGNLGTIIRTCDWFGVAKLLLSQDTVDFTNEKVIQASMGSVWRQPLAYIDYEELNALTQGFTLYAADVAGKPVNDLSLNRKGNTLLIIGSESHGIRLEMDGIELIKIPGNRDSKMESLNASISAAILIGWLSI